MRVVDLSLGLSHGQAAALPIPLYLNNPVKVELIAVQGPQQLGAMKARGAVADGNVIMDHQGLVSKVRSKKAKGKRELRIAECRLQSANW